MAQEFAKYIVDGQALRLCCIMVCISLLAAAQHNGILSFYRSSDNIGNYVFGYSEDHKDGGSFRRETGDPSGIKIGSYGLKGADGRVRIVHYVADARGYRATVQSNEPGLGSADPAHTEFSKGNIAPSSNSHISTETISMSAAALFTPTNNSLNIKKLTL